MRNTQGFFHAQVLRKVVSTSHVFFFSPFSWVELQPPKWEMDIQVTQPQ